MSQSGALSTAMRSVAFTKIPLDQFQTQELGEKEAVLRFDTSPYVVVGIGVCFSHPKNAEFAAIMLSQKSWPHGSPRPEPFVTWLYRDKTTGTVYIIDGDRKFRVGERKV
uniref:Uncharacterized protein n=1 Tax=candidate division WWE3 bacterium TaxID=2053526 RepID=A0A7C4XV55_UNCKA